MLTVIHGDDINSSRNFFLSVKIKYADAPSLEGDKLTLTDIAQVFASNGLFTMSRTVFIEQLLAKRKKSKELAEIIRSLKQFSSSHEIYLWEGKEVEKSTLQEFSKDEIRQFKLPQTLFTLLDNLKPKNGKQLLSLFHQTTTTTEVEMVFFMLVRHIRVLIALKHREDTSIDEVKRLAPWQITKLQKQAGLFKNEELLLLYERLFAIEVTQKTGTLRSPLIYTIDFLLVSI